MLYKCSLIATRLAASNLHLCTLVYDVFGIEKGVFKWNEVEEQEHGTLALIGRYSSSPKLQAFRHYYWETLAVLKRGQIHRSHCRDGR